MMTVSEALKERKSTRAFLPKAVPQALIEEILEDAKHAPSGVNMQPWHVCVVSGEKNAHWSKESSKPLRAGIKR